MDRTPECISLFIVPDTVPEGPIPETIRASFFQEGFGTQETIICILDDDPGKIIIIILLLTCFMLHMNDASTSCSE